MKLSKREREGRTRIREGQKRKRTRMAVAAVVSAGAGGYLYAKNPGLSTLGASGLQTDLVVGGLGTLLGILGKGGRSELIGGIGLGRLCVAIDKLGASKA